MHEYAIAQALVDRVLAEAGARAAMAVASVTVRVGAMSGVDPGLLASAYEMVRQDTLCVRAPLEIVGEAAAWRCRECDEPVPAGGVLQCPACRGPARLARGGDLILERVELEVP